MVPRDVPRTDILAGSEASLRSNLRCDVHGRLRSRVRLLLLSFRPVLAQLKLTSIGSSSISDSEIDTARTPSTTPTLAIPFTSISTVSSRRSVSSRPTITSSLSLAEPSLSFFRDEPSISRNEFLSVSPRIRSTASESQESKVSSTRLRLSLFLSLIWPFSLDFAGVYRKACEVTMRILRDNKDSLMSVLEAFVHDPLVEWENDKARIVSSPSSSVVLPFRPY